MSFSEFTWKIRNYSQQKFENGPGKFISSRTFPADCNADLKFILGFYPQGRTQFGDTEVSDDEKGASLYSDGKHTYIAIAKIAIALWPVPSLAEAIGNETCTDILRD